MVKHDIQYGEWNYYTLQCGMWLWNNDSEIRVNSPSGSTLQCEVAVG